MTIRIDRDEFENIYDALSDRSERREGEVLIITGKHEDHGRVTLRREEGVFTVEAESTEFVRPWGEAMERAD